MTRGRKQINFNLARIRDLAGVGGAREGLVVQEFRRTTRDRHRNRCDKVRDFGGEEVDERLFR